MKVLVLGNFGFKNNQLDGQTIKTRTVYKLLMSKESTLGTVTYFDTQQLSCSKFLIFKLFSEILSTNKLLYLPAHNNLKYLFPLIFVLTKIRKIDICYVVIGGWLADYLKNKKLHIIFLKRIKVILSETELLKKNLVTQYQFKNVIKFPNFRIQTFVPNGKRDLNNFKIVFMARINKMKGLDSIFNLAEFLENSPSRYTQIQIDFFGQIDKDDEDYFWSKINQYKNTHYKGVLEPERIYSTLEQYDVLVLPTKYYTEGFPGSILDAFISGIPVIVTNWKHATEFVDDNTTGIIVPFTNGDNDFIEAILKLYLDYELLKKMKYNAMIKSKEYSAEYAWNVLSHFFYDKHV